MIVWGAIAIRILLALSPCPWAGEIKAPPSQSGLQTIMQHGQSPSFGGTLGPVRGLQDIPSLGISEAVATGSPALIERNSVLTAASFGLQNRTVGVGPAPVSAFSPPAAPASTVPILHRLKGVLLSWSGSKTDQIEQADGHLDAPLLAGFVIPPGKQKEVYWGRYLSPNEPYPQRARPILRCSPAGIYLSVGTERSFAGAALTPKVTHLVVADYDAAVIDYNRINTALMQLAGRSRAKFVHLRQQAPFSEVAELARHKLLPRESQAVLDEERFAKYRAAVSKDNLAQATGKEFKGANYLKDDALFGRLATLADNWRIASVQTDLGSGYARRQLWEALRKTGSQVAVLDISNTWGPSYLGEGEFTNLLAGFLEVSAPESLLMFVEKSGVPFLRYYALRAANIAEVGAREIVRRLYRDDGISLEWFKDFKLKPGKITTVPVKPVKRNDRD